jgi:hypothetical protein
VINKIDTNFSEVAGLNSFKLHSHCGGPNRTRVAARDVGAHGDSSAPQGATCEPALRSQARDPDD